MRRRRKMGVTVSFSSRKTTFADTGRPGHHAVKLSVPGLEDGAWMMGQTVRWDR